MAASTTPRPPKPADARGPVHAALQGRQPELPIAVAFSGGADSTALVVGCAALWPGHVHAIHIHHGLQAAADGFERQCRDVCERLGVRLHVVRVQAGHAAGESPEDAARRARYRALAGCAATNALHAVWLAHQADDQAETLLLALSRGAGLPGLAAMPARFERHGMRFERPLLEVAGGELREWLRAQGIAWVEDPSNADTGLTRNRIRHQVLPALESAFPQFRDTFARSARHAAQAQLLLDEVAAADLAAMDGAPAIEALQRLSRERQANLLRHWLRSAHGQAASTAQLEELLDQVRDCRTRGHAIRLKAGGGFVERQGTRLAWGPPI